MRQASISIDRPLAFAVGLGAPLALAIQGGGYDIVAHQITSLVIWWLLALGFAFGVLPRARWPQTTRLPLLGFVLLGVWTAASLLWTGSSELTFNELARLVGYAGVAALALTTLHRGNWRAAAGGLTTAAVAVSVLAVASRVDPGAFSGASSAITIEGRLGYPLGYWNAMGAWSVMAFALALGWSTNRSSPVGRRLAVALLPTIGLSIYLTYSRGAIVGAAVGLAAILLLAGEPRELLENVAIGAVTTAAAILLARTQPEIINASGGAGGGMVVAVLVALGGMCAAFSDALARRRLALPPWRTGSLAAVFAAVVVLVAGASLLPPEEVSPSASITPGTREAPGLRNPASRFTSLSGERSTIWPQALDAFESKPLLGIGPGTFVFWWSSHEGQPPIRDAHSLYLQELSELGLPGFFAIVLVVVGLLAASLHAVRRLRRSTGVGAALVAAFVTFCVQAAGDWLWKIPALVALATIAVIAAIASVAEPCRPRRLGPRGLAFIIVAVIAGALMVPGIASTELSRDSVSLAAAGRTAEAVDYAQSAIAAEPWSSSAQAQLATAQQARHQLADARASAQRAAELAPQESSVQVLLAQIDFHLGLDRAAVGRFRAASRLVHQDPHGITVVKMRRGFRQARREGSQVPAP
jgi:O-antigen ligase